MPLTNRADVQGTRIHRPHSASPGPVFADAQPHRARMEPDKSNYEKDSAKSHDPNLAPQDDLSAAESRMTQLE